MCTHPGSLTPRGEDILPQGVLSALRGHTSVSHSGDLLSRVLCLGSVPPCLTSHCPTVSWALGHRTPSRLLLPEPRLRPSVSDINPLAVPSPFSEGDVTFDEVSQVGSRSWTHRSVLSPLPGASAWKSRLRPVPPHPTFYREVGCDGGTRGSRVELPETRKSKYKADDKVPDLTRR